MFLKYVLLQRLRYYTCFKQVIHLSIHDSVRVYVLRPPYKCSSYIFNAEIYSDSNLVLLYNGSQDI